MEAIVLLQMEFDDNKENINPFTRCSSNKVINGGVQLQEKPKLKKNPVVDGTPIRRPLQDITHLFVNVHSSRTPVLRLSSPAFSSLGFRLQGSALPVAECRKRKLAATGNGIDSMRKNAGKILRTGFR